MFKNPFLISFLLQFSPLPGCTLVSLDVARGRRKDASRGESRAKSGPTVSGNKGRRKAQKYREEAGLLTGEGSKGRGILCRLSLPAGSSFLSPSERR